MQGSTKPITASIAKSKTASNGNWVLLATILASSMAVIDSSALNVALPSLQRALQAGGSELVWVVNAYTLLLAALILVGGSLGDIYGRKKIMIIGIAIFVVSSLCCGVSPSMGFLIAARSVQGVGGALMIPGSLAIISSYFGESERGKAIGIWSAAGSITVVLGPVLGGFLTSLGFWRAIFLINLPIGIATIAIMLWKVPESRNSELKAGALDFTGGILTALGLASLTYGLTEWAQYGLSSPEIYLPIAFGVVTLTLFVFWEARAKAPMMPLYLFGSKIFSGANLLTLFLYGALNVVVFFLPIDLIQIQGYTSSQAGLAFLAFPLPLILLSRWSGAFSDRYGSRWPLITGPLVAALSFLYLSSVGLTSGPDAYWSTFFPGMVLFGVGMAITVVPLTNTVMSSVKDNLSGTASGINNAVTRVSAVLSLALLGSVAVLVFENRIDANTRKLPLSEEVRNQFKVEARRLAAAKVPEEVPSTQRKAVDYALKLGFTETFSYLLRICAVLAVLSSGMAALLIVPVGKKAVL